MKFALNGALTIGTLDGANIEIREAVGAENFHLFGLTTPEVETMLRQNSYDPWYYHSRHPEIRRVLDAISAGRFTPEAPETFHWIFEKLLSHNERYMLGDARFLSLSRDAPGWNRQLTRASAWKPSSTVVLDNQRGAIAEAVLTPDDLARAARLWLINSVRLWMPATLAAAGPTPRSAGPSTP